MTNLNHEVAVHIMGWEEDKTWILEEITPLNFIDMPREDFDPANDMNHCMMVVEKMREDGWQFVLYTSQNKAVAMPLFVHGEIYESNEEETLNLAIIKSALLAKGIKIGK